MTTAAPARAAATSQRIEQVRQLMAQESLDAILARSTDRYLNEYVPKDESTRLWLTGFSGSMGDAVIGRDVAWLCVDGRYYLQADEETEGTPLSVDKVPLGTAVRSALFERTKELVAAGARRVGYEPDRFTAQELELLRTALEGLEVELVATSPSLIERARGEVEEPTHPVRVVTPDQVGASVADKLTQLAPALAEADVDAFVIQRLDALAWISNLRGRDLPFQATYRGLGIAFRERLVVATDPANVPAEREPGLEIVPAASWANVLPARGRVGYDPASTSAHVVAAIEAGGAQAVAISSPLEPLKAKKNLAELVAMKRAFAKADAVVEQAVTFVQSSFTSQRPITELDLAQEVERLFLASGATGLSFRVIAAAGANGAHIHYGSPDAERPLEPGQLVLLDTGGYYHEGYATDLTRTFLAGPPDLVPEADPEQKRIFTTVLKGAIAGMSARLPVGARGEQLDALVRGPIWAEGLDYLHGTGHGVGINVHEAPPRVSTRGGVPVEVGHVFSIEPGVYVSGWGGVRIENLCTVVESDVEGFVDVVPLTSAALDERLIDWPRLTKAEVAWLKRWEEQRQERLQGAHS